MPKTTTRTATRRGLLPIGLAALACVGACALPLIAAGGVLGGGLALMRDACLAPIAIPVIVLGALALVVWILRARRRRRDCQDAARCDCASDGEPNLLQSTTFRPGP
jgi:mercuric ion transport protein